MRHPMRGRLRTRPLRTLLGMGTSMLALVLVAGCGTNFGTTDDGKQKYRWKMTVTTGTTSTWYTAAQMLADSLEEETNGRITLEIFGNERLSAGEPTAGVEQLMDGAKDFSYNSPIIYAGVNAKFGAVTAPFLYDSLEEGQAALEGEGGDVYRELLAEHGVELLGWGESGMRELTNNRGPVTSPEDMAGLKLRIPGFGLYTDFYRDLGANPTTMPFSEVYTSLQQGAIDGQENPIDVIYSSALNEVQPYMTLWGYSYDPLILGINKDLFDSLSDEDRKIVTEAAAAANEFQIEENRAVEEQQLSELEDAGMEITELDNDQTEAFKQELSGLYERYRSIWGPEMSEHFIPEGM